MMSHFTHKFLIGLLVISFSAGIGSVQAFQETFDDGFADDTTALALEKRATQRITEAMEISRRNYWRKHISRNNENKNIYSRRASLQAAKKAKSISDRSTELSREGEFVSIPYYSKKRASTSGNFYRPNAKQTFRARAIDYYVRGGDAGTESLKEDLIYGSDHQVDRAAANGLSSYIGSEIIAPIRAAQKKNIAKNNSTTDKPSTARVGDSRRYFSHPYMPRDY